VLGNRPADLARSDSEYEYYIDRHQRNLVRGRREVAACGAQRDIWPTG
jgi:hypothetical protein